MCPVVGRGGVNQQKAGRQAYGLLTRDLSSSNPAEKFYVVTKTEDGVHGICPSGASGKTSSGPGRRLFWKPGWRASSLGESL